MANGRCFFKPQVKGEGPHPAHEQMLDGEYVFRIHSSTLSPLDAYNAATRELQGIVAACLQDGKSLRARDSSCPLTGGAAEVRLIDATALRLVLEVPKGLTDDRYEGDVAKLRFVECGNTIAALDDRLSAAGLSLKASAPDRGQTLASALSAGSDGGAYRFGAIPEMVVGLHFVVGPSRHVYLERESHPVMKADFARRLGSEFRRDDALFDAALVNFGSFGILHGVMIETRERFRLGALRFKRPYDAALKAAITACDPTLIPLPATAAVPPDRPHHFELLLVPNECAAIESAFVFVMYEQDEDSEDRGNSLGASGLEYDGRASCLDRDLFRRPGTLGRTLASGVGMPAGRAVEAMETACRVYRDGGEALPVLFSCRFVKGTKALLGFTRFGSTAIFEMEAIDTPKTRAFFGRVWSAFDAAGIPFTVHWGKFDPWLTPARLRSCYGDSAVDQWIASREALLESPAVRKVFTNDFIGRLGLAT